MITPIKTEPVFKQYIWDGSALKDKYNKNIKDNSAAESWEISCHDEGLSLVAEGEHKGKTLKEVIMSDKENMLGSNDIDEFPLLVKFPDANLDDIEGKEKAIPRTTMVADTEVSCLVHCDFFAVTRFRVATEHNIINSTYELFNCIEGSGKIVYDGGYMDFKAGDSIFIPAAIGFYTIKGKAEVLVSYVPKKSE